MHYISNKIVLWLLQNSVERQTNLTGLYSRFSITPESLAQSDATLNSHQFAELMRALFELLNDESAGYCDKPLRLGTFRMMCHATIGCNNLRQALLRMMSYFSLISDEFDWLLEERGEEAKIQFNHQTKEKPLNGYFVSCMLSIVWRWAAWMVDYPLLANRVYFTFDNHKLHKELTQIFKSPVYFAWNNNQLIIPSHYLSFPVRQNSQSLVAFLRNSPECLLSHYQTDNSLSAQIKAHLETSGSLDNISLSIVASQFNLSSQSLARRLRDEGHQFQELKDKVRKAKAIELLLRSDYSISEISSQLGFSEGSVFYRTFKKWTGMTPKQYRQQSSSRD